MCLIIAKRRNVPTSKIVDVVKDAIRYHSDGVGIAFKKNGSDKVYLSKGYFTFESFMSAYDKLIDKYSIGESDEMIIHLRQRTSGEVNEKNCHPFVMGNKRRFVDEDEGLFEFPIVAHNGIVMRWATGSSGCDTYNMVSEICGNKKLISEIIKNPSRFGQFCKNNLGENDWNKFAMLHPTHEMYFVNEKAFTKCNNGLMLSLGGFASIVNGSKSVVSTYNKFEGLDDPDDMDYEFDRWDGIGRKSHYENKYKDHRRNFEGGNTKALVKTSEKMAKDLDDEIENYNHEDISNVKEEPALLENETILEILGLEDDDNNKEYAFASIVATPSSIRRALDNDDEVTEDEPVNDSSVDGKRISKSEIKKRLKNVQPRIDSENYMSCKLYPRSNNTLGLEGNALYVVIKYYTTGCFIVNAKSPFDGTAKFINHKADLDQFFMIFVVENHKIDVSIELVLEDLRDKRKIKEVEQLSLENE